MSSSIADRETTPIFDQLKSETPELEIPTSAGLTYEECIKHTTVPITEPTEDIEFPNDWKQPGLVLEPVDQD